MKQTFTHLEQSAARPLQECLSAVTPLKARLTRLMADARFASRLADAAGVQQLHFAEAERDVWQVGLVTASGRFLMVTYFNSPNQNTPPEDAQRFQEYLARTVDLPVLEAA